MSNDNYHQSQARVAAVVLTAGRSLRFGRDNKVLATLGGRTLIERTLDAVRHSAVTEIVVVASTGDVAIAEEVRAAAALGAKPIRLVTVADENPALSKSLKAGIAALAEDVDGALVCLADMPFVSAHLINRLLHAYQPPALATVPIYKGRWGNPVLIRRPLWPEVEALTGDQGAKPLLQAHERALCFVELENDIPFMDIDTADDLAEAERLLNEGEPSP